MGWHHRVLPSGIAVVALATIPFVSALVACSSDAGSGPKQLGDKVATVKVSEVPLGLIEFTLDDTRVISSSTLSATMNDAVNGKVVTDLDPEAGEQTVIDPSGSIAATTMRTADGGAVVVSDIASGKELRRLAVATARSLVFSDDGRRLALLSGGEPSTLQVFDVQTGSLLATQPDVAAAATAVFSADASEVAVLGTSSKKLYVRSVDDDMLLCTITAPPFIRAIHFSPDGATLAASWSEDADDATVQLWDAASGTSKMTMVLTDTLVVDLAYNATGDRIATANSNGTATVFDSASGAVLQTLNGHTDVLHSIEFSPDGTRLLTSSKDNTVKLWSATTGDLLTNIDVGVTGPDSDQGVQTAIFNHRGDRIVTEGGYGRVAVWATP